MTAGVEFRGVSKAFGGTEVIRGIDLVAPAGKLTVLLGPSGCGKTTLLRIVAGLEEADEGEIRIDGRIVNGLPPKERDIAIVFQSYALYPHMTVAGNLAFALEMARLPKAEIKRRVDKVARMLQIDELLDRKPRELSGGQQQRVAMGRAMVREPRVCLLDEPLSNLDARLRGRMRGEIARLQGELAVTMIYVTHDQVEALTLAHRVVVLDRGRVAQVGRPLEVYDRPADLFVAGFVGAPPMNLHPTRVIAVAEETVGIALPRGSVTVPVERLPRPGAAATLGIRPEHVEVDPGAPFSGVVAGIERLGSQTNLTLAADEMTLTAVLPGDFPARPGDRLHFDLPGERCHLFDEEGRRL